MVSSSWWCRRAVAVRQRAGRGSPPSPGPPGAARPAAAYPGQGQAVGHGTTADWRDERARPTRRLPARATFTAAPLGRRPEGLRRPAARQRPAQGGDRAARRGQRLVLHAARTGALDRRVPGDPGRRRLGPAAGRRGAQAPARPRRRGTKAYAGPTPSARARGSRHPGPAAQPRRRAGPGHRPPRRRTRLERPRPRPVRVAHGSRWPGSAGRAAQPRPHALPRPAHTGAVRRLAAEGRGDGGEPAHGRRPAPRRRAALRPHRRTRREEPRVRRHVVRPRGTPLPPRTARDASPAGRHAHRHPPEPRAAGVRGPARGPGRRRGRFAFTDGPDPPGPGHGGGQGADDGRVRHGPCCAPRPL